jgi:hypothetical protein
MLSLDEEQQLAYPNRQERSAGHASQERARFLAVRSI